MGKSARLRQERLPEKLLQIRNTLGLSQTEMLKALGVADVLGYKRISDYELGKNEPPLRVILAYARLAKVSTDVLIDDRLTLPKKYLRTL
jgi:transcriptional regulator with XRE-family HTH domain